MEKIFINGAKSPLGHYTPGILSNNMIYVSGQLPFDPFTGEKCEKGIEEETKTVLSNIKLILESGGSSIDKVVKVNIFLTDMSLWDVVNKVYSDFFGEHKPARIVVNSKELHFGFSIEIDAIAEV